VYEDLAAKKQEFPELAEFGEGHVALGDGERSYAPNRPQGRAKVSRPTIAVGVRPPQLVPGQVVHLVGLFLPRQEREVSPWIIVDDARLHDFVKQTIAKDTAPLVRFERVLGGEPLRDGTPL